ncbi:hypothetical protein EOL94_02880 [bacterium]|nr:hypothetical protein [bacterium]
MEDVTNNTLPKNPHHNVYDQKHYATRVYFYFKDYENPKAAEEACYEYRNSIPKLNLREIYADYSNKGYYFFL